MSMLEKYYRQSNEICIGKYMCSNIKDMCSTNYESYYW